MVEDLDVHDILTIRIIDYIFPSKIFEYIERSRAKRFVQILVNLLVEFALYIAKKIPNRKLMK